MKPKQFSFPRLRIRMPRFWAFKIPLPGGIYLGGGRLILVSLSAVALGFLAGLMVVINSGEVEIYYPALGAAYTAPSTIGHPITDPEFPGERSQTLLLQFPAGIRLDIVEFKNINLGKAGLATAFEISGTSTSDLLVIDELIIRNSEFPKMSFDYSEFYIFNATTSVQAAGHTFEPTMSTTTDVTISSGRGTQSYRAADMDVDRVILRQTTAGDDVVIDKLILDGVSAWVGVFDLDYVHAGTVTLENVKIGNDADINTADLTLGTNGTVTINTINDGVIEAPIQIR